MSENKPNLLRNVIFGAEDSLVSTLGILLGITSVASFDKEQIFITGVIAIIVAGTSMGAGAFLSESSANEIDDAEKVSNPFIDALVMVTSYIVVGFIPLAPYMLLKLSTARIVSVIVSVISLFILGYLPKKNPKSGLKMMIVAGTAVTLGHLVAYFFNI